MGTSAWEQYKKQNSVSDERIHERTTYQNQETSDPVWEEYKRKSGILDHVERNTSEYNRYMQRREQAQTQYATAKAQLDKYRAADALQDKLYGIVDVFGSDMDRQQRALERSASRYERDLPVYEEMLNNAAVYDSDLYDQIYKETVGAHDSLNDQYAKYMQASEQARADYLADLKENDIGTYYGETMTRGDIERSLSEAKKAAEQAEAEYNEAASLKNAGYASMAPSYQTDLKLGSAHDQQRREREATISAAKQKMEDAQALVAQYQRAINLHNTRDDAAKIATALEAMKEGGTYDANAQKGSEAYNKVKEDAEDSSLGLRLMSVGASSAAGYNLTKSKEEKAGKIYSADSEHLTDEQKRNFYALYAVDKELAEKYINGAAQEMERQYYAGLSRWAGKNWGTRKLAFLAGSEAQWLSGIDTFGPAGTKLSAIGEALVGGVGQKLEDQGLWGTGLFAGKIREDTPLVGGVLGGKSLADATGLASSILQSAQSAGIAKAAGGSKAVQWLGTILMGGSAANSDYRKKLAEGWDDVDAMAHGLAAGIAEAAFEEISIDKLVNQNLTKGFWKSFFEQGGIEMSEEICTSLANRCSDAAIAAMSGNLSEVEARAKELMAYGMDGSAARRQAEEEWIIDVINDGLGGFISGGIMTAGNYATHIRSINKQNNTLEGYTQQARDTGNIETYKQYAENNDLGWYGSEPSESISDQSKRQQKLENRQTGSDIARVQDHIDEQFKGKTVQEQETIAKDLIEQYGDGIEGAVYDALTADITTKTKNMTADEIRAARDEAVKQATGDGLKSMIRGIYDRTGIQTAARNEGMDGAMKYAQQTRATATGEVSMKATVEVNGEEQQFDIVDLKDGGNKVVLSNGMTVETAKLNTDLDTKDALQYISKLDMGDNAQKVFEAYKKSGLDGAEGYRYLVDYTTAYKQGVDGQLKLDTAIDRSSLNANDVIAAYTLGQQVLQSRLATDEARKAQAVITAKNKGFTGSKATVDTTRVNRESLAAAEKEQFDLLINEIAPATGMKFVLYSSTEKNGVYKDASGKYKDGAIWIDVHAGRNFTSDVLSGILATTGHEMGHLFKDYAPTEWYKLRSYILSQLSESELENLIHAQIEKSRRSGHKLTREGAIEEIVSDTCETFIRDSKALRANMEKLATKDLNAAQKVLQWVKETFDRIKEAFSKSAKFDPAARIMDKKSSEVKAMLAELQDAAFMEAKRTIEQVSVMEALEQAPQFQERDSFAMETNVEQVGELIAVHNCSVQNAADVLELGGFPSPSIAIVKAAQGHKSFGDVSIIFKSSAIDPQNDYRNKIYGADAWTPTTENARTEREVHQDKVMALDNKLADLSGKVAGGVFSNSSIARAYLNDPWTSENPDVILSQIARSKGAIAAYVADKNIQFETVEKAKEYDPDGNDFLEKVIAGFSAQQLTDMSDRIEAGGKLTDAEMEKVVDIYKQHDYDSLGESIKAKPAMAEKLVSMQAQKLTRWRIEDIVENAHRYIEQNGATKTEVDKNATLLNMMSAIADDATDSEKAVSDWLRPQLEPVYGRKGIYNGRDIFTASGNRRTFDQTHDPYTLENIVRAMGRVEDRGANVGGLNASSLQAVTTPEYSSLDDVRKDSGRLTKLSDETTAIYNDLNSRIDAAKQTVMEMKDSRGDRPAYYDVDAAFIKAATTDRKTTSIKRAFKVEADVVISTEIAKEIAAICKDASKLPVEYFEAKPQRAQYFDEVAYAIFPSDAPANLVDGYRDRGVTSYTYETNAERLAIQNSLDDAKFQDRDYYSGSDYDAILTAEEMAANEEYGDDYWNSLLESDPDVDRADLAIVANDVKRLREAEAEARRLKAQLADYAGDNPARISINRFTDDTLTAFNIPGKTRADAKSWLKSTAEYILSGQRFTPEDAAGIFQGLLNMGVVREAQADLAEIRRDLKGRTVYVSDSVKHEFGDDWSAFKKRAKAAGIYLTSNSEKMGIDVHNQELSDMYPGSFDAYETDLKAALENMVEVGENGRLTSKPLIDTLSKQEIEGMFGDFLSSLSDLQQRAQFEITARASDTAAVRKAQEQAKYAKKVKDQAMEEMRKWRNKAGHNADLLNAALKSKSADITKLKNTISDQNAEIKRLVDESRNWKDRAARNAEYMQSLIDSKNRDITDLQKKIDDMQKKIDGKVRSPEIAKLIAWERARAAHEATMKKQGQFDAYRDRQRAKDLRGRIVNLKKDLQRAMLRPTDTNYVPAGLAKSLVAALEALDTSPGEGTKGAAKYAALSDKLRAMALAYDAIQNSEDVGYEYSIEYDKDLSAKIAKLAETMDERNIRDLTSQELQEIYDIVRSIRDTMVKARKFLSGLRYASVREGIEAGLLQQSQITPLADVSRHERRKRLKLHDKLSPMRDVEAMSGWNRNAALYEGFQQVEAGDERRLAWELGYQSEFRDLKSGKNEKEFWKAMTKELDFGAKAKVPQKVVIKDKNADNNASQKTEQKAIPEQQKEGKPVLMTKMQAIQIYMTAQREAGNQKLEHLFKGGATIRNAGDILAGKKNIRSNEIQVTPQLIRNIEKSFTEWDRQYMETMRAYLKREGNAVNRVFYTLKHRVLHLEDNYVPTKVDKAYLDVKLDSSDFSKLFVKNPGSTQEIKEGAPQPLIIDGMETMMNKHVAEQAQYIGLAIPIRDFAKMFNGKIATENGVGYTTLKTEIERNFGEEGTHLIVQALIDVQGGSEQSGWKSGLDEVMKKIQGAFVRHALLWNLSVTIKQAASYAAAGSVLSREALLKGNRSILNKSDPSHSLSLITQIFLNPNGSTAQRLFSEIDRVTALHADRRNGMNYAEVELGKKNMNKAQQKMKGIGASMEQNAVASKVREIGTALNPTSWIQRMDVATTAALWVACKEQVRMENLTGEAATARLKELYERCLRETQPMYDSLHRTAQQKTGGSLSQYLFPFRTVPVQNHGQMVSAYERLLAAKTKGATEKAESVKFFRKTLLAQIESAAVFSAMTFAAALAKRKTKKYRDEDGEMTVGSVAKGFGLDVASTLVSVGSPMWGSELWSIADRLINKATGKGGYTYDAFSVGALDMINDTADAVDKIAVDIGKKFRKEDVTIEEFGKHMLNLLTKAGNVAGIPADTVKTYTEGFIGNIKDVIEGRVPALNDESWERSNSVNAKRLIEAMEAGDAEKAGKVLEELKNNIKAGKPNISEKNLNSTARNAINGYLKEEYLKNRLTEEKAIGYMIQFGGKKEDDAFWAVREWEAKEKHKGEDDYTWSKYENLRDIMDAGGDISAEIDYLAEHGVEFKEANSEVKQHIGRQFKNGDLTQEEAMALIQKYHKVKDEKTKQYRADTEDEAWFAVEEWKTEDYNKYSDVDSAIYSGGDITPAAEILMSHGVSEKAIKEHVGEYVRDLMEAGAISEDGAAELLMKYQGKDADEAYWAVDKWTSQNIAYAAGEEFNDSNYRDLYAAIDANKPDDEAIAELTDHGYKDRDIRSAAKEYLVKQFEEKKIDEQKLRNQLAKYAKITKTETVNDIVAKASCYRDTGHRTSNFKEEYLDGEITAEQVKGWSVKYDGKTAQEADSIVRYWNYEKQYPSLEFTEGAVTSFEDGSNKTRENGHRSAKAAGMSFEQYLKAKAVLNEISDTNGNRTGEDEYIAALAQMNLTAAQKDALYYEKYKGTTKYSRKKW